MPPHSRRRPDASIFRRTLARSHSIRTAAHRVLALLSVLSVLTAFTFLLYDRHSSSPPRLSSLNRRILPPAPRRRHPPTLEIFTAPRPITQQTAPTLRRVVRSWQVLHPRPTITLLGHGSELPREAARLNVRHDPHIDHTFQTLPTFNSLIARANRSTADVALFINADIILFPEFLSALHKVAATFHNFVMLGARYDLHTFPNATNYNAALEKYARHHAVLHAYGGVDFWAWNPAGPRLFDGPMPPFVLARGKYDNWFTHHLITAHRRHVVDVTEAVLAVHIDHPYTLTDGDDSGTSSSAREVLVPTSDQVNKNNDGIGGRDARSGGSFWSFGKTSRFELFLNIHLSLVWGHYTNGQGTPTHAPWKLTACYEAGGLCLVRRIRPALCDCEYVPFVRQAHPEPLRTRLGLWKPRCGMIPARETVDDFALPVEPPVGRRAPFGLPLTAGQAVAAVTRAQRVAGVAGGANGGHGGSGGLVVVTAVNFSYRVMMMNWVCNLRRLGVSNFVVAALDRRVYVYGLTHGVAMYYEGGFDGVKMEEDVEKGGKYGSDGFKRVTTMKTRVVTRMLRMGHDVVWSDVDVVWLRDARSPLMDMEGDMVVQSNAPDGERANGVGRINSGFYLARCNGRTIAALERVVAVAARSGRSEQPCFYDVLCGAKGQYAVGEDRCWNAGVDVDVRFLSRTLFANGLTNAAWEAAAGRLEARVPGAFVLHNNWIVGVEAKWRRMRLHGLVMFDEEEHVCRYAATEGG